MKYAYIGSGLILGNAIRARGRKTSSPQWQGLTPVYLDEGLKKKYLN
jgi:hypothetical protein